MKFFLKKCIHDEIGLTPFWLSRLLMLTKFTGEINILLARDLSEREARPTEPLVILQTILPSHHMMYKMYFIFYGTYKIYHSLFIFQERAKLKRAVGKNVTE